ncbi:hypothetical protein GIB67_002508 [Kingdonia uniflora]|uniref:Cytochrome c-553 n=1 Tax=Kingdonia uniflora TaxID=39325 RepID=A0A7J7N8S8_9MAGN|nr:hypothetical protein GIB67_002508 [Kingdonia uniflora]
MLSLLVANCCSFSTKRGYINEEQNSDTQQQRQIRFPINMVSPLMAALVALSPLSYPTVSLANVQRGEALFHKACIGCHTGGGNIIQPGATLFEKDLQRVVPLHRNGIESEEEIYKITYYGNGRMPGFGEKCTPRGQCTFGARLQDEEIKLLAEYVKSQADQGWTNFKNQGD